MNPPKNATLAVGYPQKFTCTAKGDSSLELSIGWLDGNGDPLKYTNDPRIVKLPDNSLLIRKVTAKDSGL